jgi:hypothetical protein
MGVAALAGALAAAVLRETALRRIVPRLVLVLAPAFVVVFATYGVLSRQVGMQALTDEGRLFYHNIPEPLIYFNKRMFGFEDPLGSLVLMGVIALRIVLVGASMLLIGVWIAAKSRPGFSRQLRGLSRMTAVAALAVALTAPLARFDLGPFLPMPAILIALLIAALARHVRRRRRIATVGSRLPVLIVLTVFALASLARMSLRVRSGGAYSSYLLPASVTLFVYLWLLYLPRFVRPPARAVTRRLTMCLLALMAAGVALSVIYKFRSAYTYALKTPRGTMVVEPSKGAAFAAALRLITDRTQPDDYVAVLPEGTSLLFFSDRRNPLNEEIATPGLLNERRAIERLEKTRTRLLLVTNRPTVEFGATAWGRDYNCRLADWMDRHYRPCGSFGDRPEARVGAGRFFIHAYCRTSAESQAPIAR